MKKQLTKAEEEIMLLLWEFGEANVAKLIEAMPTPKPAYNTVSTIVRILENKNFVTHKKVGKGYIYYPMVAKKTYSNLSMNKLINGFFGGSFKSMVSFFVKENNIGLSELETILKEIQKNEEEEWPKINSNETLTIIIDKKGNYEKYVRTISEGSEQYIEEALNP